MYRLLFDTLNNKQTGVLRLTDGACIPFEPANTDYQAYLKWLDAGNTPEAADAATAQEGSE